MVAMATTLGTANKRCCCYSSSTSVSENPLLLEGVLHKVFTFIDNPADRRSISSVCRAWRAADRETRTNVYVAFTYSVSPNLLTRRFSCLKSLKLKGKPRAYEFNLLPENWGGSVEPWVKAIVTAYPSLSSLHLRRMEVTDVDLLNLGQGFGNRLEVLKLDFCSGFSTAGLLSIARYCRKLKELYLENSTVRDEGLEWLREFALNNKNLEVLDFQLADLPENHLTADYLKLIISNCANLKSIKFSSVDGDSLREVLSKSTSLMQLGTFLNTLEDDDPGYELPKNLVSVSGDIPAHLLSTVGHRLVSLDLMTATSSTAEDQHAIISSCPNLENLQVRTIIGDAGLRLVAENCKKLKKIRVEEQGDHVYISNQGVISLAQGCTNLQKMTLYVSGITNAALATIGRCCRKLVDFRLILTDMEDLRSELPLDQGYLAVMKGCPLLSRMCIYVQQGALTDQGLAIIGSYGSRLKALLLGCVGHTDEGFKSLAAGCTNLERLEMRDCPFTEDALVYGVSCMKNLKLFWVQGYIDQDYKKLLALHGKDGWNVEYFRGSETVTVQSLLYRSLVAGRRLDCPDEVISPRSSEAGSLDQLMSSSSE